MDLINANMLQRLADDKSELFRGLFPELIKRLIIESSESLAYIRIPSLNDIWAPGFDGIVENDKASSYVCEGKSVWELGTNGNSLKKINDDYKKRTKDSLGYNKEETTFYLVVPRVWAFDNQKCSISKWETEHNDWKKVRVYDATIISDWINSNPAVAAWFCEQLHDTTDLSFKTVTQSWILFSKYTSPELSHELFLTGRIEKKESLLEFLSIKKVIKVKSKTKVDAIGFCLSAIMTDDRYRNSVIVVEDENTYKNLCKITKGKIYLLTSNNIDLLDDNNNTIICYNSSDVSVNADIELQQLKKDEFLYGIEKMGIDKSDLSDFYFHTHGHLLALFRRIPGLYTGRKPAWSDECNIEYLVPLLFLRKINSNNSSHRYLCEYLCEKHFEDIVSIYNKLSNIEDAPIKKIESVYSVISSEEIWKVLNLDTNGKEIQRLSSLITHIIKIYLNEEKNDLQCIEYKHLLNVLICNFITYKENFPNCSILKNIIKDILKYLWLCDALWDSLPLFAEIEPELLMQEYEADLLIIENSVIYKQFLVAKRNGSYTHFLHSFQKLAESGCSKIKVCNWLFDLCKLDVEYLYNGNTPISTLLSVLWIRLNNNALSLKNKKDILLSFIKKDWKLGVELAIKSIAKDSDISSSRIGENKKAKNSYTYEEYFYSVSEILKAIIDNVIINKSVDNILELIGIYFSIPIDLMKELLLRTAETITDDKSLIRICNAIRDKIFLAEMCDNDFAQIYLTTFKECLDILEAKLSIKKFFAVSGNYFRFNCFECIDNEQKQLVDDEEYIRKFRISVLNDIENENLISILIINMDDYRGWGFLLAKSNLKKHSSIIISEALKSQKYDIIAGFVDEIDKSEALEILNSLATPEAFQIYSLISRNDIINESVSQEFSEAYWSHKIMRSFDEDMFHNLLRYNPTGLLYFYAYVIDDIRNHIKEILEVFDAIIQYKVNNVIEARFINIIIEKLDVAGCYSDEYALKCIAITELLPESYHEWYESVKLYYYNHSESLIEMIKDDLGYYKLISKFSIPSVYENDISAIKIFYENMSMFFDESNNIIEFAGVLLGKMLKKISLVNFIKLNFPEIIEQYYCSIFRKGFIDGFYGTVEFRRIGDGSAQKKESEEFLEISESIEIEFPNTASILRCISNAYKSEAREDFLFTEFNDM